MTPPRPPFGVCPGVRPGVWPAGDALMFEIADRGSGGLGGVWYSMFSFGTSGRDVTLARELIVGLAFTER